MKKAYALVCGLMAIFTQGYSDDIDFSPENKYYLSPESIAITQEGIFVHLDNAQYKIDGVFSDARGVYALKQPVNSWKCSKGHPNPPWAEKCLSCPERR